MAGDIRSVKDLDVWKVALDLAVACYDATKTFPRGEQFGLTAQIRKSAVSVAPARSVLPACAACAA